MSRFGERFRDGQYSLVSLLFAVFLLTVLTVPSHLKGEGGTCVVLPRALWSRRHWQPITKNSKNVPFVSVTLTSDYFLLSRSRIHIVHNSFKTDINQTAIKRKHNKCPESEPLKIKYHYLRILLT